MPASSRRIERLAGREQSRGRQLLELNVALSSAPGGGRAIALAAELDALSPDPDPDNRKPEVPIRDLLLAGLDLAGAPLEAAAAGLAATACSGWTVTARQVSSARRTDRTAWDRDPGPSRVILAPALHSEDLRPLRNTLTSSAWPLAQRIVGPLSPRCNYLRTAIRVAERYRWAQQHSAGLAKVLEQFAWRFTRGVAGIDHPDSRPEDVSAAAAEELALSAGSDADDRRRAAERLSALPTAIQMFGDPEGRPDP